MQIYAFEETGINLLVGSRTSRGVSARPAWLEYVVEAVR